MKINFKKINLLQLLFPMIFNIEEIEYAINGCGPSANAYILMRNNYNLNKISEK